MSSFPLSIKTRDNKIKESAIESSTSEKLLGVTIDSIVMITSTNLLSVILHCPR